MTTIAATVTVPQLKKVLAKYTHYVQEAIRICGAKGNTLPTGTVKVVIEDDSRTDETPWVETVAGVQVEISFVANLKEHKKCL